MAIVWIFVADRRWLKASQKPLRKFYSEGKHPAMFGTWRLDIGPEEMRTTNGEAEAAWKMTAVESVDVTPTHCYIFTGQMDARMARRAFPSDLEFDEFVESARSF